MAVEVAALTILKWIGGQLAGKAVGAAWDEIFDRQRRRGLADAIQRSLASDSAVRTACDGIPQLQREELSEEQVRELMIRCTSDNHRETGKHLLDEQLVKLSFTTRDDSSIARAHEALGAVVQQSVLRLLTEDQVLLGKIQIIWRDAELSEHHEIHEAILELQRQHLSSFDQINERLSELGSKLDNANLGAESAAHVKYLLDENIRLADSERALLDERIQHRWDEIHDDLAKRNHDDAVSKGKELEQWLNTEGLRASRPLCAKAYALLSHLAVIDAAEQDDGELDLSLAWAHCRKARADATDPLAPQDEDRLISLEAKLLYLDGTPDEALRLLENSQEPSCVSIRLAILLDDKRAECAADIADGTSLHEKWVEHAVAAYALCGRAAEAQNAIEWAKGNADTITWHRCIVAFARAFLWHIHYGTQRVHLSPLSLSDADRLTINELVRSLRAVTATALASDRLSNGLEEEAAGHACLALHLLNRRVDCQMYAALLAERRPIPFSYASAVFRGDILSDAHVCSALREDYPNSFDAQFMALLIEVVCLHHRDGTFDRGLQVSGLASSDEERDRILALLSDLAESDQQIEKVNVLCGDLLPDGHRRRTILAIEACLRNDDSESARHLLDTIKNRQDPEWLSYSADTNRISGNLAAAADDLQCLAGLVRKPEPLYRAATAAFEAGRVEVMVDCLEDFVKLDGEHVNAHHNLASGCAILGRHRRAAEVFAHLSKLAPHEFTYTLQQAGELALVGELSEAIEVSNGLCGRQPYLREAILQRAWLLRLNSRSQDSWNSLHAVRDRFWDDIDFLAMYMALGFEVGRQTDASKAIQQILVLQKDGTAKKQVLHAATPDEVKMWISSENDVRQHLGEYVLQAKCPWTLAGGAANPPAYAIWAHRTLPGVVADTLEAKAELSIYATNAFTVRSDEFAKNVLDELEAPDANRPVVADISALVTLQELGLLERAVQFMGTVVIPDEYRERRWSDHSRLSFVQQDREQALETLIYLCEGRHSGMSIDIRDESAEIPRISHSDGLSTATADSTFTIEDVGDWLLDRGRIDVPTHDSLKRPRQSGTDHELSFDDVVQAGPVLLEIGAALALHAADCLTALVRDATIQITPHDMQYVRSELNLISQRRELAEHHAEMFATIDTDTHFESRVLSDTEPMEGNNDDEQEEEERLAVRHGLAAPLLAVQEEMPLLADDRCCQMVVLNSHGSVPGTAFGTDQVLLAMYLDGSIKDEEYANAILQLMRWRYRFLLPDVTALLHFASRYRGVGDPLREIGQYMHDCMRDPGLLAGREPTTPPTSVATHYFLRWTSLWARFVAEIWRDPSISDDQCRQLTEWTVAESLPCPPKNIPNAGRQLLAAQLPNCFVTALILHGCTFTTWTRSAAAITVVADAMGIDQSQYERIITRAIQEDAKTLPEDDAGDFFRRRMFLFGLVRDDGIEGLRSCLLAQRLGFVKPGQTLPLPDNAVIDAIRVDSGKPLAGPYIFSERADPDTGLVNRTADFAPTLLALPNADIRSTVLDFVSRSGKHWLSPKSQETVTRMRTDLSSEQFDRWFPAACALQDCLDSDIRLHLAALRQCITAKLEDGIQEHWNRILRPDLTHLSSVHGAGLSMSESRTDILNQIDQKSLKGTLDAYERRFGHLPLAPPLAMGTVVAQWYADSKCTDSPWEEVWQWVDQCHTPFRAYHACHVFAEHPELIPTDQHGRFWSRFDDALALCRSTVEPNTSVLISRIRDRLTQHFLQHLELHSPERSDDHFLCLSFWLATEVAHLILDETVVRDPPGKFIIQLHDQVEKLAHSSNLLWMISRPSGSLSTARHMLLRSTTPWSIALVQALASNPSNLHFDECPPTLQNLIADMLSAAHLRFDAVATFNLAEILWAHDVPSGQVANSIAEHLTSEQSRSKLQELLRATAQLRSPASLATMLETLHTRPTLDQRFIADVVRSMSYTSDIPADSIQQLLRDRDWWLDCIRRVDFDAFSELCDCFGQTQVRERPQWDYILPLRCAEAVSHGQMDEDHRRSVLQMGILSAATGESMGVIRRVAVEESNASFVRGELAKWRSQLAPIVRWAPPLVATKLRDLISSLPI
ncbi:MAG: hypothetical protein DWQ34_24785 [Planctomycetota bacterium]|nr:MAG: hypothetical protein DWQ34_24785 [Planctomycetota bacterium]REK25333.1 MAG: hypothetical protein DWQ41_12365 [Planctomycetota bacterium]REK30139.1 MAG: hypothetical protein DWQ45_22020 [Planctomycetota bacterium]